MLHSILDEYCQVYCDVYGQEPEAFYLGYGWYLVGSDMIHRRTVERETRRLRALRYYRQFLKQKRTHVVRVIEKVTRL